MDLMEICEVFGGSILPDEYRGSYEDADRHISALEQDVVSKSSSLNERARTILLRAIFHTLSGDFTKARAHIQSLTASQHQELDRMWILRGQMYEFYAAMLQHRPTTIRFAMIPGDPYEQLREDTSNLKALHTRAKAAGQAICAAQSASLLERLEQALILDVWSFLDTLHFAYLAHPNFTPLVTTQSLPEAQEEQLNLTELQAPYWSKTLVDCISQLGNPIFHNMLYRMSTDIDWAKGASTDHPGFTQLQAEYESVSDYAGMGQCKINEGDRILSPSYTSPIAFNLICEVRDNGWANVAWDPLESTIQLGDNGRAQRCYSEALFYMEAACAPRGQAAVYLRRGCLHHAEGIRSQGGADCAHFVEAEKDLSRALRLFAKDNMNQQLVTCHLALLNCTRGQYGVAVDTARRLGTELRKTESIKMSHFLGTLMLRFAHFQFSLYRNTDVAVGCCQCATAYHKALDSRLGSLFSAEALITLFRQTHNWTLAEAKARETIHPSGPLQSAIAHVDALFSRGVGFEHFNTLRTSIMVGFDGLVRSVCSMTGNENLRLEWDAARHRLKPRKRPNIFESMPLDADARRHLNNPLFGCGESDLAHMMETYEARNEFMARYSQTLDHCFKAIGRGDMDAADAQLLTFVSSCEPQDGLRAREVLDRKIPALAQLGRVDEMRWLLPQFLSEWFTTDMPEDIGSYCLRRGVPSDVREHAIQERRNIADEDISMCFLAQAWDAGIAILSNIAIVLPDFCDRLRREPRPDSWLLLTSIGAFHERDSNLGAALESYLAALYQVENMRAMIPSPDNRRRAYSTLHTAELFCGLARTSLALSQRHDARSPREYRLPTSSWLDQALIFLERGRARSLLDILQAHDSASVESLQDWMEELTRNRLLATLIHSQCEPGGEHDVAERARQVAQELGIPPDTFNPVEEALKYRNETAAQIFKNTMFVPDIHRLLSAIPPNAVVIEVGICMSGLIAMCISSSGIQSVHQSSLGVYALRRLVVGYLGKILAFQKDLTCTEAAELRKSLSFISAQISTELIEPFAEYIRASDTVIFVPTSYLNVFPLGALMLDDEPLVVAKPIYQVPSLAVLQRISEKAAKSRPGTRICAVADCDEDNPIVYVGPEVVSVCDSLGAELINAEGFMQAMREAELMHIASHGTENYSSPWESTILGNRFRVLDMAQIDCSASLVVFSCCLSGKGEISSGDDLVGFAHAVLQSGAQAFLGGLWKVSDGATMLLMHLFYRVLSAHKNASSRIELSVADAWHQAVRAFYRLDKRRAGALVDELEALWRATKNTRARPPGNFDDLEYCLDELREKIADGRLDFASPCNWAPFALVGRGSARIRSSVPDKRSDGLSDGGVDL
ncbi:CHAT domain-containing protein [Aspergillus pseudodeflectus]|uniref:CHAT domain-containing protein n=1 Tax=Aspergillus pseudodeflectus TaxID=176178 RepID=A0ABR4KGF9_9EURO